MRTSRDRFNPTGSNAQSEALYQSIYVYHYLGKEAGNRVVSAQAFWLRHQDLGTTQLTAKVFGMLGIHSQNDLDDKLAGLDNWSDFLAGDPQFLNPYTWPLGLGEHGLGLGGKVLALGGGKLGTILLAGVLKGGEGAKGISSLIDDLLRAAGETSGKGGLTNAGRALQKHGDRLGSAFPVVKGKDNVINSTAQNVVNGILKNPKSTVSINSTGRFGEVIDVVGPDGRGVRFTSDGKKLIGFLEPPRR